MFDSLSDKLGGIFDKLKKRGALSESHVDEAMREVRLALLEADVALPVVKDFISKVKEKAVGQEVVKSVTPGQMVVKIVNDQLVEMLGGDAQTIDLNAPAPVPMLMVGLQGSGKTTSTAKIAKRLKDKEKKNATSVTAVKKTSPADTSSSSSFSSSSSSGNRASTPSPSTVLNGGNKSAANNLLDLPQLFSSSPLLTEEQRQIITGFDLL